MVCFFKIYFWQLSERLAKIEQLIEQKGYKMNDLYLLGKNKKGLQGRKASKQAYIFAI